MGRLRTNIYSFKGKTEYRFRANNVIIKNGFVRVFMQDIKNKDIEWKLFVHLTLFV